MSTIAIAPDRLAAKRERWKREGAEAAHRIVTQIAAESTGPGDLLRLLGEAEARVANGPAPQVFKDAFADTVVDLCEGPVSY